MIVTDKANSNNYSASEIITISTDAADSVFLQQHQQNRQQYKMNSNKKKTESMGKAVILKKTKKKKESQIQLG
jgi:hypothetical protein